MSFKPNPYAPIRQYQNFHQADTINKRGSPIMAISSIKNHLQYFNCIQWLSFPIIPPFHITNT
jgi:hypothetical protein